jgi:hypothetical protein
MEVRVKATGLNEQTRGIPAIRIMIKLFHVAWTSVSTFIVRDMRMQTRLKNTNFMK